MAAQNHNSEKIFHRLRMRRTSCDEILFTNGPQDSERLESSREVALLVSVEVGVHSQGGCLMPKHQTVEERN